jgi:hypothetical protein
MLNPLLGMQHGTGLGGLADGGVMGRELLVWLRLVSSRVPGEPAQAAVGGQAGAQRLVGQAVEVQTVGTCCRIVVKDPNGRVAEVDAAPDPDICLQEELLSPQASGVNCRAGRVSEHRLAEADLGADSCPSELHLTVRGRRPRRRRSAACR